MKENTLDVMQGLLDEGVYDPSIFKAIFLAGGPGSGKSYVTRRTTGGFGMKLINPDPAFEKILKDAGKDLDMTKMNPQERDLLRLRAKDLTNKQERLYIAGRLGLILDGTGKDYDKISRTKKNLDTIGYDSFMIFVNTSLEVALERNRKRARTLPEPMVKDFWTDVQRNIGKFQGLFGTSNFVIVDNNKPDEDIMTMAQKRVRQLVKQPIQNGRARAWIKRELDKRRKK
jgi:shikimate kinase